MPHAKFDEYSAYDAHSAVFLQRLRTQFYSSQAEAAAAMRAISHSKYPSEKLVREVEAGRMEATWQYKMLLQLATGIITVNRVKRSDTDVQPFVDLEAQMVRYRTVVVENEALTCPTCGQVHHLPDCNGKNGELRYVAKPHTDTQRREYWRPCLSPALRDRVEASGKSVDELLRIALKRNGGE